MKNNFIKLIKARHNLSNEIKNMTIDEKNEDIENCYNALKDIPIDLDFDLSIEILEMIDSIYYEAKASGVDKKHLKKLEELLALRKASLKDRNKQCEEGNDELSKLFDSLNEYDLDNNNNYEANQASSHTDIVDEKNNSTKFTYESGDIEIIDDICDTCVHKNPDNKNICSKYPNGKPKLVNVEYLCSEFEDADAIIL